MNKNLKKLKSYLNENGLRFNLNEQRIWKYIEEIFGENRARELSDIFDETYIEEGNAKDVNRKYQFCKSFEEATTLMYFQSDWFLKNSIIILEDILIYVVASNLILLEKNFLNLQQLLNSCFSQNNH